MKRVFCLFLCVLLACTALCLPAQAARRSADIAPAYTPSTAEDARAIPLNLRQGNLDLSTGTIEQSSWQTLYNPYTAQMMVDLATASSKIGENDSAWRKVMENYGYTQLYHTQDNVLYSSHDDYPLGVIPVGDNLVITPFRSINALIGIREVTYNGRTRYAVAVTFRGTGDLEDLLGTDLLGGIITDDRGFHKGFSDNAEDFYQEISPNTFFTVNGKTYSLWDIYDEMKDPDSDFCMLVMGHSLGGALASVLVGRFLYDHGVDASNIAAYTIGAAPSAALTYEYPHGNIINIISQDDLVPGATIYFNKQLGKTICFDPDDDFRLEHYGREYVEVNLGCNHAFWQTIGFARTGANPHLIKTAYEPIVQIINDEIAASTADNPSIYTQYSTSGYNNWGQGESVISPYTFGDFSGDIYNGGSLVFAGGVLQAEGDVTLGKSLYMHHEDDYLLVNGDLELTWGVHQGEPEHLTAGTVEIRGDLTTDTHDVWSVPYHATDSHRTVISGTNIQNIGFNGEHISVANLCLRNPRAIITGMTSARLAEDALITIPQHLVIQQLDLDGHSLVHTGTMYVKNLTMGGGGLQTTGDLEIHTVTALDGGMSVGGNFETTSTLPFANGILRVEGDCHLPASLIMQNQEDYLFIGGDLTIFARENDHIPDDHLSAGTVEIKGDFDFDDMGKCTANAYHETGTHKTILSGDGPQVLWWVNKASSTTRFENLCIRNPLTSLAGVPYVRLGEDAAVAVLGDNTLPFWQIDGTLDPGGHTLTISSSDPAAKNVQLAEIHSLSYPDGGNVEINGDLKLHGGKLEGELAVSGDLSVNELLAFDGGSLTVDGDCSFQYGFSMHNDTDYLLVCGDLWIKGDYDLPQDHLTAGTVELKGNLAANDGSERVSYCATGTHRTIFSGDETQEVYLGALEHKRLQACFRNPDIKLTLVHTVKLMEGGALNVAASCNIYDTLDLNGYPLRLQGQLNERCRVINGTPMTVAVKTTAEGDSVVTITRPELSETAPGEVPSAIHILFTGFDEQFRMIVCDTLTFTSESDAAQTVTLAKKLWGDCTYISAFWVEKDFAPFCTAMDLDLTF